jgi:nitrogen fixation/metabolism regulation signal transduction histidine kinase
MRKRLIFGSGVVLLAILLTLVVSQGSFKSPFAPSGIEQTYLFWAVSTLIFILTVMLGFILFRTAVKLYIERQANRPGSHIKSRLIGGALALSVLPVFFLVLWSFYVLNRNLESWFSRPARGINIDLTQVGSAMDQEVRDKLTAQAHWLALLSPGANSDAYQRFCVENQIERVEIETLQGVKRVLCSQAKVHDGELYTARLKTDQGVLTLSARMPLNLAATQSEIQRYMAE